MYGYPSALHSPIETVKPYCKLSPECHDRNSEGVLCEFKYIPVFSKGAVSS